jgi:hypothetical protein
MTIESLLNDTLVGKKLKVRNQYSREEVLTVEKVKIQFHSVQTGPSNRENDWWPSSNDWYTVDVTFTNGYKKEMSLGENFEIVN